MAEAHQWADGQPPSTQFQISQVKPSVAVPAQRSRAVALLGRGSDGSEHGELQRDRQRGMPVDAKPLDAEDVSHPVHDQLSYRTDTIYAIEILPKPKYETLRLSGTGWGPCAEAPGILAFLSPLPRIRSVPVAF